MRNYGAPILAAENVFCDDELRRQLGLAPSLL